MDTPSPMDHFEGRSALYVAYLDAFRAQLADAVAAMDPAEAAGSRLASGWTPLGLAVHLTYVERRWLVWGFCGEEVAAPWADRRGDAFVAPPAEERRAILDALAAQGRRSAKVLAGHALDETGQPGERWEGETPPTLERVALHLVQEYARHLGHLDVVVELADAESP